MIIMRIKITIIMAFIGMLMRLVMMMIIIIFALLFREL